MFPPIPRRGVLVMAAATTLGMTACGQLSGSGGVAGLLAREQPLEAGCHGSINGYFAFDMNGDDRAALTTDRLSELQDFGNQVLACGGYLKAVTFAGSAANTHVLGDTTLPSSFGTDTARLIHGNKQLNTFIDQVKHQLDSVPPSTPSGGSEIIAQFERAAEVQAQRGSGRLDVEIATGGIGTYGSISMQADDFTHRFAISSARRVPVPNLAGAYVRIAGIGKTGATGNTTVSSNQVKDVITFYDVACTRTGAKCLVTNDYTKGN